MRYVLKKTCAMLVTLFIGQTINIGYGPTAIIIAIVAVVVIGGAAVAVILVNKKKTK